MKRNALIVLIVFSTMDLFSQINRGNTIMSFDGNYMKVNSENGVTTNRHSTQGQYLNVGPSIGYFITDRFVAGVGLDYYWEKEKRSNSMFINNEYVQMENMKIKSDALLPCLFAGYYYPINDKFYFSANLKISYGNIKTESHSLVATAKKMSVDELELIGSLPTVLTEQSANYDNDYFSTKITPELTYFVSRKLGLNLGLGGIAYSLNDWESDNSSWAINFNPNYWRLGVKWMF